MNIIELAKYLLDEDAAEEYLLRNGILKNFTTCPYCGSSSIGKIRRSRMKCYKCKKEWHRRKGSFLESRHITYSKFIGVLKLFSDENGVISICNELALERKHCLEIYSSIRSTLFIDKQYFKNDHEKAIIWAKDRKYIQMDLVSIDFDERKTRSYLELLITRHKEFGGMYSFIINSAWKGKKIRYKNLVNSFISYIKMKSISYRGISRKNYFEYLLEQVARFNLRDRDFYEALLKNLRISKVAETPPSHKNNKSI